MRKFYVPSKKWTTALVAALVVISGIVCCIVIPPSEKRGPVELPTEISVSVTVHVSGCVNDPDTLITLPEGSRVSDAIEAAGGASAEADLSRLNLAALLKDGQKITVPSVNASEEEEESVNINLASAKELEALPGIGPSLARRIVDYRNENGAFTDIDELKLVSGIGEKLFQQLAEKIRV